MKIHHYYHLYADGAWEKPVKEHFAALAKLPFRADTTIGIVGTPTNRNRAYDAIERWADDLSEFDEGYEQQTLDLLWSDALDLEGPVLYAHTKGAGYPTTWSNLWRECMTSRLVAQAERCIALLEGGADTVGCHWLTPEAYPESVQIPYYGGNFWWATPEHLQKLDPPSRESRYHAEAWLGSVRPQNPIDLAPGWPGSGCANH